MDAKYTLNRATKIWLWAALALGLATTALNFSQGRVLSSLISLGAMAGLGILLFTQKKVGFGLMCLCYLLAFAKGVLSGFGGETGLVTAIVMSFIGSALTPGVTYLFLRGCNPKL